MRMRWVMGAVMAGALAGGADRAVAQLLPRSAPTMATPPRGATSEWKELLKTQREMEWDVRFHVYATFCCPLIAAEEGEVVPKKPVEHRFVGAMPVVASGATQRVDIESVKLGTALGGVDVPAGMSWLKTPLGTELMRVGTVDAPKGKALAPVPHGQSGRILFEVGLTLEEHAILRSVKLDEALGAKVRWPMQWPAEAQGVLDAQAYRDLTPWFDATGEAARLGMSAVAKKDVDQVAMDMCAARGIKNPKDVGPLKLAQEVALEFSRRMKAGGDGATADLHVVCGNLAEHGQFGGLECRDAVTVLTSGSPANAVERVVALSAVYNSLGLPSRTMLGFELGQDDERQREKAISRKGREGSPEKRAAVPAYDVPPRVRAWVEFALYDSDRGLAWVPVDCTKGGEAVKVGEVEGSEKIAVIATSLWPVGLRGVLQQDGVFAPCGFWGCRFEDVTRSMCCQWLTVSGVRRAGGGSYDRR